MSRVKRNLIANFAGTGWQALMAVAFIPVYIRFLGIESYGIIGIYGVLATVLQLLNLGMSPTVGRQLALLSGREDTAQEQRDLLRTLETVFWVVSVLIALLVVGMSSLIATSWVKSQQLPVETIRDAIRLAGPIICFRFLSGFYQSGLKGVQRQVVLNGALIVTSLLRSGGVVLILWLVSPTIYAFFLWQLLVSVVEAFVFLILLWRGLPPSGARPRFRLEILRKIWRFALGMTGSALTAVLITQTDKIILSRVLPLSTFGYYALASNLAAALYAVVYPVSIAVRPRLTELVGKGDQSGLREMYHYACQVLSVVTLPLAIMVAFFSWEILLLWTQSPETAQYAYVLVSLLILGVAANALVHIPVDLQIAEGWVSLQFFVNVAMVVCIGPGMILGAFLYEAKGVAAVLAAVYGARTLAHVLIMHRRLLPGERGRWFLQDVGLPLLAPLVVIALARFVFPTGMSRIVQLGILGGIWGLAVFLSGMSTPKTRFFLLHRIFRSPRLVVSSRESAEGQGR